MNLATLDQIVSKLSREQCLQILNDPRVDAASLQRAMAAVVAASPAVAPTALAAPAAVAPKAPATPKAPKAPATPATPAVAPTATGVTPADAIKACVAQGLGFAAGDLGTLCGLDPRDSSIRTAIKNALAATVITSAGVKRFMRYGGTAEIANAASLKASGKA